MNKQTELSAFQQWRKDVGKWLNRLHWRSTWKSYMNDTITYGEFKEKALYTVNAVRTAVGDSPYSAKKLDCAWQYRNLGHEDYAVALDEMMNAIFGWW